RMDSDRAGGRDALVPRLLEPHGRDVVEGDFLDYPLALLGREAQIGQHVRAAGMKHRERKSRRSRPENALPGLHVANLRQTAQNLNAPRRRGYAPYTNATLARVTDCEMSLKEYLNSSDTLVRCSGFSNARANRCAARFAARASER